MRFFTSKSQRRKKRDFPLPKDFFAPIPLDEREIRVYRTRMDAFLQESLEGFAKYQDQLYQYEAFHAPWEMVASTNDVKAFVHHNEQDAVLNSRVIGRLELEYRDFLRCLYADSRSDYFKVEKQLLSMTLDANVLQTIESHKPHSFFGIKWAAYDSFAPQYRLYQQDTCFLEYSGFTHDLNGREVGYILQVPVKRHECPDLFERKLLVRFERSTAMLVAPLNGDAHCCRLFMTGHYNFANSVSTIPFPYFREQVEGIDRIAKLCQSMQAPTTKLLFIKRRRPSSKLRRQKFSNCSCCHRHFHAFRARHSCLLCGETICRSCFVVLADVCSPGSSYFGKKKFKICMRCCNGTTQKEMPEWLASCDSLTESTESSFGSFRSDLSQSFKLVNSQLHSEGYFIATSDMSSNSTPINRFTLLNSALLSSEQRNLLKQTSLLQQDSGGGADSGMEFEVGSELDELDLLEAEEVDELDELHELDVIEDVEDEGHDYDCEESSSDDEDAVILGDNQSERDSEDVLHAFPLVMVSSFHHPIPGSQGQEELLLGLIPSDSSSQR